jgi:hypothetical protein
MDKYNSVHDTTHWSTAYPTQKLDLHQSDSDMDLFEYYDQHEAESIQNLIASYGKTFQAIKTGVENEYENMDVLVKCNQLSGN